MNAEQRQHECALVLNDIVWLCRSLATKDPFMQTFKRKDRREILGKMQTDMAKWVAGLTEEQA